MKDDVRKEIIEHYRQQGAPGDQQMVIAMLREMQEEEGGVLSRQSLAQIAKAYAMKESLLSALIRRVPGLRSEEAAHRLEICGRCAESHELAEYIEKRYGVKPGGVSQSGGFSCHVTGCMKNCLCGPSVRWDGELYSEATAALIDRLVGAK